MTKNRAGILYGIAFIAFAVIMTGFHLLLTGFNTDFGAGVAIGLFLGYGLMALCSRRVRELD